jgi:phosphatidylserine/phosphatidylglycerophosphate/cardiolipin synthase-like enzyme
LSRPAEIAAATAFQQPQAAALFADDACFNDLAETPGVEIRIKHETSDPMHLKSYQIDGRLLRTGAANFSASGLKRQDNDLIVIESAEAAASFKHNFDARFANGEALAAGAKR